MVGGLITQGTKDSNQMDQKKRKSNKIKIVLRSTFIVLKSQNNCNLIFVVPKESTAS